jgi:AraC-like DNA-binding protein
MKITEIKSCFVGPAISPEQFIAEHIFVFLVKGTMNGYDGNKRYTLEPGESCIVRKNRLARYNKRRDNNEFEKVVFIFDERFLKDFLKRHPITFHNYTSADAFIKLEKDKLINSFLLSLEPYFTPYGQISEAFVDMKREELLLILLQVMPVLSDVMFDFGIPGKLDLEAFIQQNYKFNVSAERFAFLTGRSLSAFKRDFKSIFHQTPNRWLVKRRLQEARFLIEERHEKASDIYLQLGFEDLSHFSFAFKKEFGVAATKLPKHGKEPITRGSVSNS